MNHFDPDEIVDEKRQIASKFYPLIGPYDSGDVDVLECHLLQMKMAGISGVIVDWYGLSNFRDYPVLHRNTTRLLQQCERLGMKFVICYEDQTIPALVEGDRIPNRARVQHAVDEINWLGKYWFKSGAYVKLDGRPVLLSFGHAGLTSPEWKTCLSKLESPVAYFSQDIRRDGAVGGFGWPAPNVGMRQVSKFAETSANWPHAIPAAFPRFDDIYSVAKVSDGYPVLDDNDGQTLKSTLETALNSEPRFIQIATWNDWGEGTQIEPSVEFGYRDLGIIQAKLSQLGTCSFTNDDLRLPMQLYEMRTTGVDSKLCDEIALELSRGNTDKAKELISRK